MIKWTEEQVLALIESGGDWEKIEKVLCELEVEDLIYILDRLNSIIELIEMNQYARLIRKDD